MEKFDNQVGPTNRRPWQQPDLEIIGTIGEVLKGGGGKLSIVSNDTGDVNKPSGLE